MDRWGGFISTGAIHRDWRSLRPVTSSSPLGLGRSEMKKKARRPEPYPQPVVVGTMVLTPTEAQDLARRDPRSVR